MHHVVPNENRFQSKIFAQHLPMDSSFRCTHQVQNYSAQHLQASLRSSQATVAIYCLWYASHVQRAWRRLKEGLLTAMVSRRESVGTFRTESKAMRRWSSF